MRDARVMTKFSLYAFSKKAPKEGEMMRLAAKVAETWEGNNKESKLSPKYCLGSLISKPQNMNQRPRDSSSGYDSNMTNSKFAE